MREKIQLNEIRDEKVRLQHEPVKLAESLGNTLKIYIQINWKIRKKWKNF
jgi:hypothetical protein